MIWKLSNRPILIKWYTKTRGRAVRVSENPRLSPKWKLPISRGDVECWLRRGIVQYIYQHRENDSQRVSFHNSSSHWIYEDERGRSLTKHRYSVHIRTMYYNYNFEMVHLLSTSREPFNFIFLFPHSELISIMSKISCSFLNFCIVYDSRLNTFEHKKMLVESWTGEETACLCIIDLFIIIPGPFNKLIQWRREKLTLTLNLKRLLNDFFYY